MPAENGTETGGIFPPQWGTWTGGRDVSGDGDEKHAPSPTHPLLPSLHGVKAFCFIFFNQICIRYKTIAYKPCFLWCEMREKALKVYFITNKCG